MKLLELDIQNLKKAIEFAPISVLHQFKVAFESNPNDVKVKELMPLLKQRLGIK
jgi:hypothetical protein